MQCAVEVSHNVSTSPLTLRLSRSVRHVRLEPHWQPHTRGAAAPPVLGAAAAGFLLLVLLLGQRRCRWRRRRRRCGARAGGVPLRRRGARGAAGGQPGGVRVRQGRGNRKADGALAGHIGVGGSTLSRAGGAWWDGSVRAVRLCGGGRGAGTGSRCGPYRYATTRWDGARVSYGVLRVVTCRDVPMRREGV